MRAGLTGLAAGALACAPAAAEPPAWMLPEDAIPARLVAVGTWDFAATRRGPDGRPECTESWTFNADGSGLIVSGEQRSEIIWKAIRDESIGQFIYVASKTTNGASDCLGNRPEPDEDSQGQPGFQLLFYGTGTSALVCGEGALARRADESIYTDLLADVDCWGRITPTTGQ